MKRIAYSEYMQDIEEHKRYTSMYAQYQYMYGHFIHSVGDETL